MIDIGVNLTSKKFSSDLVPVLARAREAGVDSMVVTGTSERASREAAALAREHELWSTAGVHPHDAKSWSEAVRTTITQLCADERVVAVGECGLDFDRNFSPPDDQRTAFREQLEIAESLGMPLFLHERAAHDALVEILEPRRDRLGPIVVHCFTGTADELTRYLELDLHIGITGWICDERRGTHLLEIVDRIPPNRLMIETDAPWLTPRTLAKKPKGGRNEPAFLVEVRDAIARATGRSAESVADDTTATTREFFGI